MKYKLLVFKQVELEPEPQGRRRLGQYEEMMHGTSPVFGDDKILEVELEEAEYAAVKKAVIEVIK